MPAEAGRLNMADRAAAGEDQGGAVAAGQAIRHDQRHQARRIDGNPELLPLRAGALRLQNRLAKLHLPALVELEQDFRGRHGRQPERGRHVSPLARQGRRQLQRKLEPAFLLDEEQQRAVVLAAEPGRLAAQLRRLDRQSSERQVDRLPLAAQFHALDAAGDPQLVFIQPRVVRCPSQHDLVRRDGPRLDVALGFLPESEDLLTRHQHAFRRAVKQHLQLIGRDVDVADSRRTAGDLSRGRDGNKARQQEGQCQPRKHAAPRPPRAAKRR